MDDTTARSAPGEYRGQACSTGTEDTAGGEHRLYKPGRRYGHGGHGIVSTVSLNRDEMAGAEITGWMTQWRMVSTVSLYRDEGQSAPIANVTEYEWRRFQWKVGYSGFLGQVFVCILVSLSFLVPFWLLVLFAGWGCFRSSFCMIRITGGILGIQR